VSSPLEDVERLVEVVLVERRAGDARRHDALDDADTAAALLAADENLRIGHGALLIVQA
jgi:hypothetical protein